MGVGQAFAFIGLVGTIVLQGVFSGGLAKPQWILTFSAFFHTIRLFGGTLGAIYMAHFLAIREKLHSNLLGLHVTARKLDYRWKSARLGCRHIREIIRRACGRRTCCQPNCSPAAPSGLRLEP